MVTKQIGNITLFSNIQWKRIMKTLHISYLYKRINVYLCEIYLIGKKRQILAWGLQQTWRNKEQCHAPGWQGTKLYK